MRKLVNQSDCMDKLVRFILFAVIFSIHFNGSGQVQCAVDAQVLEGDTVNFCQGELNQLHGSDGYIVYTWSGPESGAGNPFTVTISGEFILTAWDSDGCPSKDTIQVIVNSLPQDIINSSEGNPLCPETNSTILTLNNPYSGYLWFNGSTNPDLLVTGPGDYSVLVTDNLGCSNTITINLGQMVFTLETSAAGICAGESDTLTASGGTNYIWTTGQTGNSIIVAPDTTTTYSVIIMTDNCVQTLSKEIFVIPFNKYELVDTLILAYGTTVTIEGPEDFSNFLWTPDDYIRNNDIRIINYEAVESQDLHVQMTSQSGCVVNDVITIIVIRLNAPNAFSPNADNFNDYFVVPELDTQYEGSLMVWNSWGDIVYDAEKYANDWKGTCESERCLGHEALPEGTYFYKVMVKDLPFTGYITLAR